MYGQGFIQACFNFLGGNSSQTWNPPPKNCCHVGNYKLNIEAKIMLITQRGFAIILWSEVRIVMLRKPLKLKAYDAPPDPLVGWRRRYSLPIPHLPSGSQRLWRLAFRVFHASQAGPCLEKISEILGPPWCSLEQSLIDDAVDQYPTPFACLCSYQRRTFWAYFVTINLFSLYLMNFMLHITLDAAGDVLRVHYKNMKCDVSFSQRNVKYDI